MTEENQGYTSQNEEDAIRKENEDKQPSSTTITLRIPYSLKARLYDLSEQSKMTINAFAGTRLYKYVQGEIAETKELQEQVERLNSDLSEANSQMQKWEEMYKKLEKKAEEHGQRPTQNQLDKVKQEKDQLAKQVSDLQKQLKQAESDKGKTADEKDKRIKQLEQELDQYKADTKQKENERKSEAAKRQTLEQSMTEMQYYINRHAAGLFKKPHQFVKGVPLNPDDPDEE
jgi:chromosome segregation ATPase